MQNIPAMVLLQKYRFCTLFAILLIHSTTETTTALTEQLVVKEKSPSQLMLDDMKSVMDSTLLHLTKQKTQLSLNFLNQILPPLRLIHSNMTSILKNSELNDSDYHTLSYYREADENLENQLMAVKEVMDKNRILLHKFSVAYGNTEHQLKAHYDTLENIYSLALNASLSPVENTPNTPGQTDRLRRDTFQSGKCGGILTSDGGSIDYKSGEALNSQEGCFWIIASSNRYATSIDFSLKAAGFIPTNETFLSVGYFPGLSFNSTRFIWTKFQNLVKTQKVHSSVAFIHFVSTSPLGDYSFPKKGFTLEFEASYATPVTPLLVFTPMFLTGASDTRRYPPNGQNYTNNERTAIVIQPTEPNSVLEIKWWDFENNINYDWLNIWKFDETFTWRNMDTLFSSRNGSSLKRYSFPKNLNPILLTFRSDFSNVYSGFEFEWKTNV